MTFVIAIDGPAASGKGTLAKKIARHFGYHHLDTGLLYRATAASLLRQGLSLDDARKAAAAARALQEADLLNPTLSDHLTGEAASRIAILPEVRAALFEFQQDFAAREPGAVLDGRDIASVICPDANIKLYVTATPEVRAARRSKEAITKGQDITFEQVLEDIKQRDERDQNRKVAPLKPAQDAHLIDTSEMDIETAFQTALSLMG